MDNTNTLNVNVRLKVDKRKFEYVIGNIIKEHLPDKHLSKMEAYNIYFNDMINRDYEDQKAKPVTADVEV